MMLTRRALSILTVLLVLGVLGGSILWRLRGGEGRSGEEAPPGLPGDVPVSAVSEFPTDVPQPVTGARVVRDTLWITVTAAGEAQADRRVILLSRIDAVVEQVRVREDETVREGELLVRFDTTEYALALARTRAEVTNARARFQEMTFRDDEIPDEEVRKERRRLARARSGLAQAEVALREAELNLARTSMRAPFGGRVADVRVVEGQHVTPGTEILTVLDLDPVRVEVQVLEREMGYLAEGRRARVTFSAFPGETFRGVVETVNPLVDPSTRTARVTVRLPNPGGRIKPGMYARVRLEAQSFPDRILVPRVAILERDRRPMLFVFEGEGDRGRAKWRYVTPGLEGDSLVEIVPTEEYPGVRPGEIVLVDGHFYLIHDAPVRLVEVWGEGAGGRP